MSLFTRRQAAREEAAARARGEKVDALRDEAPPEFRQQLIFAIGDTAAWGIGTDWDIMNLHRYLIGRIRHRLCVAYGRASLAGIHEEKDLDLAKFISDVATTVRIMDVIDTVLSVYSDEEKTNPRLRKYAHKAKY